MKITAVSFSVSNLPATISAWADEIVQELKKLLSNKSEVILYPELFLASGLQYFSGSETEKFSQLSTFIEKNLIPQVAALPKKDQLIIFGTFVRELNGHFYNSCPIFLSDSPVFYQDKIYLTPWEKDLTAGEKLIVFKFKNLKAAVPICFDIEHPNLAQLLKTEKIDMLLVPSATLNRLGNQRVLRCASARAIELGAVVCATPLVGDCLNDLIDHSEGRQGFFLPAQDGADQDEIFSSYSADGSVIDHYEFNEAWLHGLKQISDETKPFLTPDPAVRINRH